jgi:hypothetical protein
VSIVVTERSDFAADQVFASQCFIIADIAVAQTSSGRRKISASLPYYAPDDKWIASRLNHAQTNSKIYSARVARQVAFVAGWHASAIASLRICGIQVGVK